MITFETSYSGEQLGRALGDDPHELAYALNELTTFDASKLGSDVAYYLDIEDAEAVAEYLHELADKIGGTHA